MTSERGGENHDHHSRHGLSDRDRGLLRDPDASLHMSVANVTEHALCIQVAQILDGDAECAYCDRDAVLLVATGADPDYEPVCIVHGGELVDACIHTLRQLFTKNAT